MYYLSALILSILIFLSNGPAYSQSTIEGKSGYKDFVLDGEYIWLLTTTGKLKLLKLASDSTPSTIHSDTSVVALTKDHLGNIVIGDVSNQIKRLDKEKKTWTTINTYKDKLIGIVFDSQNQCLLLTDGGIIDPNSQVTYFPDSTYSNNKSYWLKKRKWLSTCAYFFDSRDNLWIGLNYGEWGGDVFAFDTQKKFFLHLTMNNIEMDRNPVHAFCEDLDDVYMAGGVSHMVLTHGSIVKFTNQKASPVLVSRDRETPEKVTVTKPDGTKKSEIWTTWKGGHLIGPIVYNPSNKCLYFYSQHGIFKSTPGADLSDIKQWQNILKPSLRWNNGQQYAAGPSMNVLKMRFNSEGTLFFLSEYDGLGVYDGKTLRYIK